MQDINDVHLFGVPCKTAVDRRWFAPLTI